MSDFFEKVTTDNRTDFQKSIDNFGHDENGFFVTQGLERKKYYLPKDSLQPGEHYFVKWEPKGVPVEHETYDKTEVDNMYVASAMRIAPQNGEPESFRFFLVQDTQEKGTKNTRMLITRLDDGKRQYRMAGVGYGYEVDEISIYKKIN